MFLHLSHDFRFAARSLKKVADEGKSAGKFVNVAEPFKADIDAITEMASLSVNTTKAEFIANINSAIAKLQAAGAAAKAEGMFGGITEPFQDEISRLYRMLVRIQALP